MLHLHLPPARRVASLGAPTCMLDGTGHFVPSKTKVKKTLEKQTRPLPEITKYLSQFGIGKAKTKQERRLQYYEVTSGSNFAPKFLNQLKPRMWFIGSAVKDEQLPAPKLPEIAFAGRSNAGKSTLLNNLTGNLSKAFVKQTPGSTTTLNFYNLGQPSMLRFVDLPGYGFANVSEEQRTTWTEFSLKYLKYRKTLQLVCLLVDSRLGLLDSDREFLAFLERSRVKWQLLFTKADLVQRGTLAKRMSMVWEHELNLSTARGNYPQQPVASATAAASRRHYNYMHSPPIAISGQKRQNLEQVRSLLEKFALKKEVVVDGIKQNVYDLIELTRIRKQQKQERRKIKLRQKEYEKKMNVGEKDVTSTLKRWGLEEDFDDVEEESVVNDVGAAAPEPEELERTSSTLFSADVVQRTQTNPSAQSQIDHAPSMSTAGEVDVATRAAGEAADESSGGGPTGINESGSPAVTRQDRDCEPETAECLRREKMFFSSGLSRAGEQEQTSGKNIVGTSTSDARGGHYRDPAAVDVPSGEQLATTGVEDHQPGLRCSTGEVYNADPSGETEGESRPPALGLLRCNNYTTSSASPDSHRFISASSEKSSASPFYYAVPEADDGVVPDEKAVDHGPSFTGGREEEFETTTNASSERLPGEKINRAVFFFHNEPQDENRRSSGKTSDGNPRELHGCEAGAFTRPEGAEATASMASKSTSNKGDIWRPEDESFITSFVIDDAESVRTSSFRDKKKKRTIGKPVRESGSPEKKTAFPDLDDIAKKVQMMQSHTNYQEADFLRNKNHLTKTPSREEVTITEEELSKIADRIESDGIREDQEEQKGFSSSENLQNSKDAEQIAKNLVWKKNLAENKKHKLSLVEEKEKRFQTEWRTGLDNRDHHDAEQLVLAPPTADLNLRVHHQRVDDKMNFLSAPALSSSHQLPDLSKLTPRQRQEHVLREEASTRASRIGLFSADETDGVIPKGIRKWKFVGKPNPKSPLLAQPRDVARILQTSDWNHLKKNRKKSGNALTFEEGREKMMRWIDRNRRRPGLLAEAGSIKRSDLEEEFLAKHARKLKVGSSASGVQSMKDLPNVDPTGREDPHLTKELQASKKVLQQTNKLKKKQRNASLGK
ncbi:unnamed protein product [Amoebophrya sp. A120]|nr:unnamed protein product [Amoebophrya sp. A120]|eukprot:GSA120T00020480001.1